MPHLEYCSAIFTDLSHTNHLRLQRIQNSCIRFISGVSRFYHISPYYEKLNIMKLEELRRIRMAVLTAAATPRQTVQAIPTSYPTVPTPIRRGVDDCPVNLLGDFQVAATLSSNSQDRAAPTQTVSQRPTKLSVNADKRVDHGSVNFAGVSAAPSSNSEERASTSAALTKDPAGSTNDFTGASFQKRNIPWNLRSTASRVLPLRLRSPTKTPPASPPLTFSDSDDDDDGVVLPRAKKVVQSLQLSLVHIACSKQSIDSDSGDDTKSHKRGILGEISPIRLSDSDTE
ncbi:tRNA modification GTPase MnmE [Frankliniella fusca]|uniref:tRNA modification GTPase MnmE n=1 Tax=Frankliniella fusca TaxID=407009 RepID=A0AAE1GSX6_9NEOP|nr:tRNA modification GTPase MnmE [Frankliniella fusca]